MAQKFLGRDEFRKMVEAGEYAISNWKKIVYSECGATGRLSILLESMWRCFFRDLIYKYPEVYNKRKNLRTPYTAL